MHRSPFFAYMVALVNVSKFGSSALALAVCLLLWLMISSQMLGSCTLSRKKRSAHILICLVVCWMRAHQTNYLLK